MLKRHSNAILLFRIASFDSHNKTLMSSFTDPLFLRSLHTPRSIANTFHGDFVHRLNPIQIYHNNSNKSRFNGLFKVKGGGVKPNGFTLTSCFDSHKKPDQKARALTQHRRLLHDLGSGPSAGTTDLADGRGAYLPTRFQGNDKIVVAVDIDEVLGNFVSALNRFIADRYLSNHSVSEYHVYEFFKIWNCSRNEADLRVHEFFKTSYFKKGIHPLPGAHKTLHKLSKYCDMSVVTSRQNAIKEHTLEWIEIHFPGLFKQIHFGNHFALHGESRPKSEICRSFGAEILIDDNPRYAEECANIGMKVLLFDYENSYPWSKTESVDRHPLVSRVHNWEEVEQQILSLAVSKC
ncbi:5'(3')-deoxyribonucleotidase [Arabidopsis thaliana x Arabidopsis arenosa]|uniref:5'(3')-deoxyribonucleotidase n=1 Tax=Arabidopsis thaliana x Arabidopsis arenosa TaxID=1240361 RepID=A0A8T1Y1V9_9BRAS|nr:5'(3')-deoxyribonucleotidase [Arabidopsis thaliana x Arabidopsis arenosa]